MNIKDTLLALIKEFSTRMQKKNMQSYASSTAFFFILSFIPLLVLLSSCLPYTTLTQADLVRVLKESTPDFANDIVEKLVSEAFEQSVAVFSISALATIWTGALGMLALICGLNIIYNVDERRGYFFLRIIAAFYTIAMIIILLLLLLIMVFEEFVNGLIAEAFPYVWSIASVLVNFRFILIIGVTTILFALIYTFVPSAKIRFVYQIPGAVFSAVGWYVFSWLFSKYVDLPNSYSIYGSLATPVVLMFWLYFCIYIFLVGAFLNVFFHPAVKVLYDDHHQKTVRKNAKKKSTKVVRKHRDYNEFK